MPRAPAPTFRICTYFAGGPPSPAPWGRASDLGALAGPTATGPAGLPERVCGRVPDRAVDRRGDVPLRLRFLGAPRVPRRDFEGTGDEGFARRLEDREHREGRPPLAEQMADLCERCRGRTAEKDDGDL